MLTGVVHISVSELYVLSRRETRTALVFGAVGETTTQLMRYYSVAYLQSMKTLTFGLTLVRHCPSPRIVHRATSKPVSVCGLWTLQYLLRTTRGQAIDAPLSEIGLQQAEAAGRYLKDVKFSSVFASDMLRAQQTAETIIKHSSSSSGLQMASDPLLKEVNFGIAEGGRLQDLREMAKAAGQSFPGFIPPKGETREQVEERVKGFLEKMLQQTGAEHWHDRGEDETSLSAPPETSPMEGKADDGVRGMAVHALVVTHGAYMCVVVHYFVKELHCSLPPGFEKAHMSSLSPNTGMCRFILTMTKEDDRFKLSGVRCVFVHRGDHVKQ